ncbi:MAG: NRDE family protein [Pyrinomonadaceae bacterium]|nr:NRDE family protein [Pyrinomonadaceae bacterium]
MCVIFVSYKQREDYPLIIAANRDEFYDRPTAAATRWEDYPKIYAGRDLVSKGTWLGVNDDGRFAAVTNFRDPDQNRGNSSRGALVADFLKKAIDVEDYLEGIRKRGADYTGFNLLAGEFDPSTGRLMYFSNRKSEPEELTPGVYGLSNHLLDTPWPKVVKGKAKFNSVLSSTNIDKEALFRLLEDREMAHDDDLPDTGVGIDRERFLSPIFIKTPIYGTRCSTVLTFDKKGTWDLDEKVWVP